VVDALVHQCGGLEPALEFLRDDGGERLAALASLTFACRSADEFMGYSPGWVEAKGDSAPHRSSASYLLATGDRYDQSS